MEDKISILTRIKERQAVLREAGNELKKHFVGLDDVIDKILASIEAWYCMPEISTRPTIICLWGLTGNGKTDLVRRLATLLEMMDSFVEIQMTNKGSSQHAASTLQSLLAGSNLLPESPGILLLDEIQRFRSVDTEGADVSDYAFQDLWMLLSDGSFGTASDRKQQIMDMLVQTLYDQDSENAYRKGRRPDDDDDYYEDEKNMKFKQHIWTAKIMKSKLGLQQPIEEIMTWGTEEKLAVLSELLNDKSSYRPEVYSKLLIIVSGNLDEAYKMASQTDNVDIDADIFHKHSLNINLLRIKDSLKSRFKPEQIARFGNTHIIYPSLAKASYSKIIERRIETILKQVRDTSGVQIMPDQTVFDAVYRNGVFPTQGTRPVFSTISSLFESALPTFTMEALKSDQEVVNLSFRDPNMEGTVGGKEIKVKTEGDIDRIKSTKRIVDRLYRTSVHEAGHAVSYSLLFGYFPTQVVVNAAADETSGFVGVHNVHPNRSFLKYQIQCLMGGTMAEEIVFGHDLVGGGAVADIEMATASAAYYVRRYGMGKSVTKVVTPMHEDAETCDCDYEPSNEEIQDLLKMGRLTVKELLEKNLPLLQEVSEYLVEHEKIEFEEYKKLFEKHQKKVEYLDAKETIYPSYKERFLYFFGKK